MGNADYYIYSLSSIDLFAEASSDASLIILSGEPFERLYSEYLYFFRSELLEGGLEHLIAANFSSYIMGKLVGVSPKSRLDMTLHRSLLAAWIVCFGQDRMQILFFDERQKTQADVARSLYHWVEVDAGYRSKALHLQQGEISKRSGVTKTLNSCTGSTRAIRRLPRKRIGTVIYVKGLERHRVILESEQAFRVYCNDDVSHVEKLAGRDLSNWKSQD